MKKGNNSDLKKKYDISWIFNKKGANSEEKLNTERNPKKENEIRYLIKTGNNSYIVEIDKKNRKYKITKVDYTKRRFIKSILDPNLKTLKLNKPDEVNKLESFLSKNNSDSIIENELKDITHYLKTFYKKSKKIEKDNSKLSKKLKSIYGKKINNKTIEELRKLLHDNLKGSDNAIPEAQDEAYNFITKNVKKFPNWTEDPKNKIEHLNNRGLKDTGKLLWAYGYDDLSLLGVGFCGVVYKDSKNNKAIKVTQKNSWNNYDKKITIGPDELSTRIVNKILKTDKEKEYFMPIKSLNGRFIYESPVATSDFAELTKALNPLKDIEVDKAKSKKDGNMIKEKKVKLVDYEELKTKNIIDEAYKNAIIAPALHKNPLRNQGRTIYHSNDFYKDKVKSLGKNHISDLIKDAVSLMEAIKTLHDHGYTHNDIKPDNFLQIEKCASNLGNLELNSTKTVVNNKSKTSFFKINNNKKEKGRLVLTDFGTIQSIKGEIEDSRIFLGWPVRFIPGGKEANTGTKEKITKREVWNAGIVLFMMLFGENLMNFQSWSFEYAIGKLNRWDLEKQFNGLLWPKLKYIYVPKDKRLVKKFIEIIRDMVHPVPKLRLNVSNSIIRLKTILHPRRLSL